MRAGRRSPGTSGRAAPRGALAALSGLVLLVPSALAALTGTVGSLERRVFHAVNQLPDWLYSPMWVFQQLGNVAVALVLLVLIAVGVRRLRLAGAALLAVVAKLALERVVKLLVERQRPASSIGDVVLRGDVPTRGLSFVSGHVVITTAAATMLMAVLPSRWKAFAWAIAVLNGVARVYVGAHNPLDVAGGAGLGLVIGAPLYLLLAGDRAGGRSGGRSLRRDAEPRG